MYQLENNKKTIKNIYQIEPKIIVNEEKRINMLNMFEMIFISVHVKKIIFSWNKKQIRKNLFI